MATSDALTEQTTATNDDEFIIKDSGAFKKVKRSVVLKREGYRDLLPTGGYSPGGAADPTVKAFVGPILLPAFAGSGANNQATYRYHIPHDWVIGSDFYMHTHWANNNASPTGNVKWKVTWYYARGYELGDFGTAITTLLPTADVSSNQYDHHITESAAITPAIVGEEVEIDGMILACVERDTTDTNTDDAFLIEFDIHYLSDGNTTVEKNESGSGFTKS